MKSDIENRGFRLVEMEFDQKYQTGRTVRIMSIMIDQTSLRNKTGLIDWCLLNTISPCIFVFFFHSDNWQNFTPKNNVLWMHYLAKKACDPKTGYRYLRTPRHQAFELLEELEKSVLSYNSCYEMAHAMCSTHSTDFPLLKKAKFICPSKRR